MRVILRLMALTLCLFVFAGEAALAQSPPPPPGHHDTFSHRG
jgi:hypothetical protein